MNDKNMKYMYKEQKLGRHDLTLKPEVSKTSLIITLLRNDARRQAIIPKTSLGNGVPHEKHFCNQFEEILLSLDKLLPDRSYLYIDDTDTEEYKWECVIILEILL